MKQILDAGVESVNDNFFFFSVDRLRELKLDDLKKLADYYDVSYNKNTSPKTIIDKIMKTQRDYQWNYSSVEETEKPMSVRIRRIKERQSGG